jgi:hypothetical protein
MKMYCEQPTFNLKCIIFTLILSAGYWWLPKKNIIILAILLYFPYLVLAWYDYIYQCKRNMGPTYLSLFYEWLKPQDSDQIKQYKDWCPEIKNKVLAVDITLLFIGLLAGFYYSPLKRWFRN